MIINKTFVALITSLSLTTIAWICFKILLDYISNQKTSRKIRFITFLLYVFYKKKLPYIKKCKMKKIIREDLKKNKYFLYYQPIVNPKKNVIIGFEGLLRFRKDNKILTPYFFIKDIENNDMLFETSLHILKLAINDYDIIKKYNNMKNDEFYISLNMSLNEIENDTFIKQICDISTLMNMKKHSICIEILEKVGINDLSKINID
ncbi:MAG: EAL domain-containing protein [Peptostreptococcaceae bacterium]|nr:EAL domain-containing protein [Peptostreptococcaceae bacterium]